MKLSAAVAGLSAATFVSAWPAPPSYDLSARSLDFADSAAYSRHLLRTKRQSGLQNSTAPLPDATALSYTVPPVAATGGKAWQNALKRAANVTSLMTLEEKVNFITGQLGPCSGNTGNVSRLGIPMLCLHDGPAGVRPATGKTQFPAGVTTAATWDRDLIYNRSLAMGQEFYDLGVNIALAPVTGGPLGRAPLAGRNWEGWAADPYATGEAAYWSVKGMQDAGVAATAKHFILYEQETYRNPYGLTASYSVFEADQQLPISSNADDQTTHELYLWPFAEAVRAGVGYFMCSYNTVNGTHACANSVTQNGLLKTELNFQGAVMSDWGGVWGTGAFAESGLDLEMPGYGFGGALGTWFGDNLLQSVQNGTVNETRINDQVTRVLTPYFALGQADAPLPETNLNTLALPQYNRPYRLVQKQSTLDLVRQIGEEGAVILKNTGGLPLAAPKQIAIVGTDAGPNPFGWNSCGADAGECPGFMNPNNGTNTLGQGSGWSEPQNLVDPLASLQMRALQDRSRLAWVLNDTDLADVATAATGADVALVFVQAFATEGYDRGTYELTANGNALINATASVNNNTVVILHIPGPTSVEGWVDHPNVTAILAPLLPGEQAGPSLVPLLYGDVSPSGKLPFTIAISEDDYAPNTIITDPVVAPQSNFSERLLIDYRWFDAHNVTPRFEFGFGLSYSNFAYSGIQLNVNYSADALAIQETNETYANQTSGQSLYDTILNVQVAVKNTGNATASEVAQLYVQYPDSAGQPPKQLRGFEKVKNLAAGASSTVTFPIRRKDVAFWDTVSQQWQIPGGEAFTFHVGSSSRTLPLSTQHTF